MSELVALARPDVYLARKRCSALQREVSSLYHERTKSNVKLHRTIPPLPASAGVGVLSGTLRGGVTGLFLVEPVLGAITGGALETAGGRHDRPR
jgi:uncharacterized membrane protein